MAGNLRALTLAIDGSSIDDSLITGVIEVTHEESSSSLMTVTGLLPSGTYDPSSLIGKEITLDVIIGSTSTRIFSGLIDFPDFDVINGLITLNCSNVLKEQLNNTSFRYSHNGVIKGKNQLGYYSDSVFGEATEQKDEIENRLETVQGSLDLLPNGNIFLTDWEPDLANAVSFGSSDVYRRAPSVKVAERGRIVNKVNIDLEFQYQRLRYRTRDYTWTMKNPVTGGAFTACTVAAWGFYPPQMSTINGALEATGLPYTSSGSISISNIGGPSCNTDNVCGKVSTQSLGSPWLYEMNGEARVSSARWTLLKRYAQNISEKITLTVNAPQSQSAYGVVESNYSHGLRVEYDASEWENQKTFSAPPSGFTLSNNGEYVYNLDDLGDYQDRFRNMFNTAKAKAYRAIAESHRQTRVMFEVDANPSISITDTVNLSTSKLSAVGKVHSVRHTIDASIHDASTEITLAVSRSVGSATPTDLQYTDVRTQLVDPPTSARSTVSYGVTVLEPNVETPENVGGLIYRKARANSYFPFDAFTLFDNCISFDYCRIGFAVLFDAIEPQFRDNKETEGEYSVTAAIRNDALSVTVE